MKIAKKKLAKPVILEQWVEVKRIHGKTVSIYYPPNTELERLRLEMDPQPELIYRRLNFVHGVPEEYKWTLPDISTKLYGGMFLHRMHAADWPYILKLENLAAAPHVIPSPHPADRPEAFGPCPCDRCTQNREREQLS